MCVVAQHAVRSFVGVCVDVVVSPFLRPLSAPGGAVGVAITLYRHMIDDGALASWLSASSPVALSAQLIQITR